MILVTGASGKTGRAVIRALSSRNEPVRTFIHREESIASVKAAGASEAVVGDLRDEAALRRAMEGARAVYHICPNVNPDEVTIGKAAISAAVVAGVEHFVFHSVLRPQAEAMPHHWNKLRVEEQLHTSGLAYTVLQPTAYMQNILASWQAIVERGVYAVPYPVETRLSLVDLEDVAEAAAIVLTEPGHAGATYELVGAGPMTQSEVAEILSRKLNRPVRAEIRSVEEWERGVRAAGLGEYQIETLKKMFDYYERWGMWGNPNVLRWLLRREPTTFEVFAEKIGQLLGLSLTPSALHWLRSTASARVLGVFDRACDLVNQDNHVLALVTSERGLNPFALLVEADAPLPFRAVSSNSPVQIEDHRLLVGPLEIITSDAKLWNPSPDWLAVRQAFAENPSQLAELAAMAVEMGREGSLLDLYASSPVPPSRSGIAHFGRGGWGGEAYALPAATSLVHGLLTRSAAQCLQAVRALAGLGSGLTPAGDDFIVGALLAVWAGLYGPEAKALCLRIAEAAASRTTLLSAAYLLAAARGECMALWHNLLTPNPQSLIPHLQSLLSVGHTSGADSLAGFIAVHHLAPKPIGRDSRSLGSASPA